MKKTQSRWYARLQVEKNAAVWSHRAMILRGIHTNAWLVNWTLDLLWVIFLFSPGSIHHSGNPFDLGYVLLFLVLFFFGKSKECEPSKPSPHFARCTVVGQSLPYKSRSLTCSSDSNDPSDWSDSKYKATASHIVPEHRMERNKYIDAWWCVSVCIYNLHSICIYIYM